MQESKEERRANKNTSGKEKKKHADGYFISIIKMLD